MAEKKVIIKNVKDDSPSGKQHRILCMTGSEKGRTYYLQGSRIVMGRDDRSDIQVFDQKSSRNHAELVKFQNKYVITDMDSQNGTLINNSKITQHTLENNDKIIIGKTVYKYNFVDATLSSSQKAPLKEVEDHQDNAEESENISESLERDNENIEKKRASKRTIILGIILLMSLMIFLDEDEAIQAEKSQIKTEPMNPNLDSLNLLIQKKEQVDADKEKKIAAYIHRGRREYREGNFLRALEEFRMVLIINPGHSQASYYKRKTQQALDNEIRQVLLKAAREIESLKFRAAANSYCSILRLLERYPEDDRYREALDKKREMEKKLGLEEDEIKCF